MAKRHGALGKNVTKNMRHPHKTKKRREAKRVLLAGRKAR